MPGDMLNEWLHLLENLGLLPQCGLITTNKALRSGCFKLIFSLELFACNCCKRRCMWTGSWHDSIWYEAIGVTLSAGELRSASGCLRVAAVSGVQLWAKPINSSSSAVLLKLDGTNSAHPMAELLPCGPAALLHIQCLTTTSSEVPYIYIIYSTLQNNYLSPSDQFCIPTWEACAVTAEAVNIVESSGNPISKD